MSIDDLKGLMDEFDPAVLLPDLGTMMGKIELIMRIAVVIGPVILLVLGLIYLFAPPKEANHHFGYRCFFGMGSVDAWRFTQRLAGLIWSVLGLFLAVIMLIVSGGFAGKEIMDLLWLAAKCVIWEAGLVAVSCLIINTAAAIKFNARGERRTFKK